MSFNTLEDVNGAVFDNQGFWWYEFDTSLIDPDGTAEFTDVKVDFCTVSKTSVSSDSAWEYTIIIDNSLWTTGVVTLNKDDVFINDQIRVTNNTLKFTVMKSDNFTPLKFILYMGSLKLSSPRNFSSLLVDSELSLDLKELGLPQTLEYKDMNHNTIRTVTKNVVTGFNEIDNDGNPIGYLFVSLLKTDFQFTCNQSLIVGEVNTVQLGTLTDYKVGGDLVGDYETKLSVLYNGKTIPVVWNETLNDYTFDLDLTNVTEEKKIRFKVIVETNDVLNHTETDVVLDANYESIDTLQKLETLFSIGGTGRLTSDLTVTNDLILVKSVNLIGNDCTIDMANHKISVGSDKTFKAQTVNFSNGVNTVQQEPNSTVEITDCSFTDCTGFGSVIDCQVDLASLDETDDFTTKLTDCTISDCDMAILHGGNLEVNRCNVNGKISNKNYPYFLYQTDGNATILNSEFNLTDNTVYDYDIEFNSCIFTCGETAIVNGYSHSELQNNNITAFFDTQRNTSTIDIQYYYSLIEANVYLQSSKGYCHSVSNVDYIFKSNVTITRGD